MNKVKGFLRGSQGFGHGIWQRHAGSYAFYVEKHKRRTAHLTLTLDSRGNPELEPKL
jgi:hypothetical protein